jgi:surface protein
LGANGVSLKYVGKSDIVPASEPLFIYANPRGTGPEWFAVVKQSTTMKTAISNYASGTSAPFIPSAFGQTEPVPFNNIVTTLMTDMSSIFANKTSFNSPIASWDTSNVTVMTSMFFNATAFNQNISTWNVINVSPKPPTDFSTTSGLAAQNIPAVFLLSLDANTVTVKYIGSDALVPTSAPLFIQANPRGTGPEWFAVVKQDAKTAISSYASGTSAPFIPSAFGQTSPVPFNNIVTTLMTDMSLIFMNKSSFNSPIASWDTSNVTVMSYAFNGAIVFNQPIGAWNTSNVTHMIDMFRTTNAFNQPIGAWNTSNVRNMKQMFVFSAAFNQPIGTWNTSKVTTMNTMFAYTTVFNQPIGAWNTGAVTDMNLMFYSASQFNQNISAWNVSNVTPKPPSNFSSLVLTNPPVW